MTHFTDQELRRWRDEGPGGDRARLHEHLRGCGACATRYAEAIRTAPLDAAEIAGAEAFVAAGYKAGAPDGPRVVDFPARRWLRPALSLAAAAVLVAAIAVPWLSREDPDSSAGVRLRGVDIQLLSPAGDMRGDVEFVWTSGLSAPRFRVEVGSADLTLYSTETDRPRLSMTEPLRQILKPGAEYWWEVTALDRDGSTIQSSPRQPFRLAR